MMNKAHTLKYVKGPENKKGKQFKQKKNLLSNKCTRFRVCLVGSLLSDNHLFQRTVLFAKGVLLTNFPKSWFL